MRSEKRSSSVICSSVARARSSGSEPTAPGLDAMVILPFALLRADRRGGEERTVLTADGACLPGDGELGAGSDVTGAAARACPAAPAQIPVVEGGERLDGAGARRVDQTTVEVETLRVRVPVPSGKIRGQEIETGYVVAPTSFINWSSWYWWWWSTATSRPRSGTPPSPCPVEPVGEPAADGCGRLDPVVLIHPPPICLPVCWSAGPTGWRTGCAVPGRQVSVDRR
jgi:hypothetical protein